MEFSFRRLWYVIRSNIIPISLSGIGCAMIVFIAAQFFLPKIYCSEVKLYPSGEGAQYSAESPKGAADTYIELLDSGSFYDTLSAQVKGYTSDELSKMISFSKCGDTEAFRAQVRANAAAMAYDIASAIMSSAPKVIKSYERDARLIAADVPRLPTEPDFPKVWLYSLYGLGAGLAIAIIAFYLASVLDSRVRAEDEYLAEKSGVPILGSLAEGGRGKRYVRFFGRSGEALSDGGSAYSSTEEEFNMLRTDILASLDTSSERALLLLSDCRSSEVLESAIRLAKAFARRIGERTILVDCDLREPSLQGYFSRRAASGLSELLSQGLSPDDVISRSGDENGLDIIFSGSPPDNPAELIAAKGMGELIESLCGEYEHVMCLGSPLEHNSDALSLIGDCGGVLLLLADGRSRTDFCRRAAAYVDDCGGKLIGAVVC